MTIPKLCRHKSRNGDRAYVTDAGRRLYLGKWGTAEAEAAYRDFILRRESPDLRDDFDEGPEGATIREVADAFFSSRANYYVKRGRQTGQLNRFRYAATTRPTTSAPVSF